MIHRLKLNFAVGLLITIAVVSIVGIILRRYNQDLERFASVDALTGAYNRNAFSLIFEQIVKEKKRNSFDLSLILFDIDHFKSINDKFGHHSGDEVLQKFSSTIKETVRQNDLICRWGGEEFVVLLKKGPGDAALAVAEKIGKITAGRDIHIGGDTVNITVSGGVVEYTEGETHVQLTTRADRLMYRAKEQGKNRVLFGK